MRKKISFRLLFYASFSSLILLSLFFGETPFPGPLRKDSPQFTMSECITRTEVYVNHGEEIRDFYPAIRHSFKEYIDQNDLPVHSFGIQTSPIKTRERGEQYILFTDRCDEKYDMSSGMVDYYSHAHPDGANIIVTRDVVVPSGRTIFVYGDHWIDGDVYPHPMDK